MLTYFEVNNYMGFKDTMKWDLSDTRDYSFEKNLVKNKISKNSIVFGKNASGKSSFCTALVDITTHLLDVEKDHIPPYKYTYIGNNSDIASFRYDFLFGKNKVIYTYKKNSNREMLEESLSVNGKNVLYHNYSDENNNFIKIKGAERLRTNGLKKQLSVIKFVYNNTILDETSVINQIITFVSGMLFFRSLKEANQFIGYKLGGEILDDIIFRNSKLTEFGLFLADMGLNYLLVPLRTANNGKRIAAKFENGNVVPLNEIASSGTLTLELFYCWLLEFKNLTFLIIDEFDAYYNHEISRKILEIINKFDNMQTMVTTHNVTLLNTDQTRPDCAYIIDKTGVRNLSSRTDKELRKNHNIEKLYREGEFNK